MRKFLLMFVIFVFSLASFVQSQTSINRIDIPVATYFYMPIGDRNVSVQSDLVWDLRPATIVGGSYYPDEQNETWIFPGNYWANNINYQSWYVYTDFGMNDNYDGTDYINNNYHPGEDWNGNGGVDTDLGQPIYATATGKVIYRQTSTTGFGNMIQVVHKLPSGEYVLSMYAHMDQVLVNEGDLVSLTTQIGTVGKSGTDYAHLHWEIRQKSFLDLTDQNTVNLKNSYPYTPTRWPGSDNTFITNNYYDPTDFIKLYDMVGYYADGQNGWHDESAYPNNPSQPFVDCYNEVKDAGVNLTPWDNGSTVYTHVWPTNGDPSSQDVCLVQDFKDDSQNWWQIALSASKNTAFSIHGQILDFWSSNTGYQNYGPPMDYEFQKPYSGGSYGNDNDQMVVQKFCKNVVGDYRKTIVYNTVSGALGNFPVGVYSINGSSGEFAYENVNGNHVPWPNSNDNELPTGEWLIDAGVHNFIVKDSQGNIIPSKTVTVQIWEGNNQVFGSGTSVSSPTNLHTQSVTSSQITIAWDDDINPSGTDYKIYRDGSLTNTGITLKQFTDVGLSANTSYSYEVSAVYDGAESDKTSPLSVTTNSSSYYINVTSPNGGETFNRGDTVIVTYDYNIPGDQIVFYYTFTGDPNDWFSQGASTATGSYTWIADDTPSDVYLIKIFAQSDPNVADMTDGYFAVVSPQPSPPSSISYSNLTATSARIMWQDEWNPVDSVDSYNVYRFNGTTTILAGSTTNLYFDDTGLQPETGYHHWVKAVDNGYESEGSNEITFVTPAGPPTPTLAVSPSSLDFDSTQTQLTFSISSNTSWNIALSDSWLNTNTLSGSNDATISVTVDRNDLDVGSYLGNISVSTSTLDDTVLVDMVVPVEPDTTVTDPPVSGEQVTFTDDFNRTDLGLSWVVDNYGGPGDAYIENNLLKLNGPYYGNVKATAVADDSLILKDVTVNFYMDNGPSTRANNHTSVFTQYLDDNNYYQATIAEDDYNGGDRRRAYIGKTVNGIYTELATTANYLMFSPGTYQFRVVNDSLSFKNISGGSTLDLSAIDNSLTEPGMIVFRAGEEVVYIDNVEISGTEITEVIIPDTTIIDTTVTDTTTTDTTSAVDELCNFTDDFNRSTLGLSWVVDNYGGPGDAYIENNLLKLEGPYYGNVKATAVADDSLILKDVTVNFYMDNGSSTRANNNTAVYIQYLDDNNYYQAAIGEDDYNGGDRRRAYIGKMVNGVYTELATTANYLMFDPGTYQFRVVNDSLSFKNISGGSTLNLSAIDNSLTEPGMIVFRAGEEVVYIDNVEISGMKIVEVDTTITDTTVTDTTTSASAMVGWQRNAKLTVDYTKVVGSQDLVNFPMLLDASCLPAEMFSGSYAAQSNGADIRFSSDSSGSNELAFEIVSFDQTNTQAEIWVKVPTIYYNQNTEIYVWYNNSSASAYADNDSLGTYAVWSDYTNVYHYNESGGQAPNASAADANTTLHVPDYEIDGKINKACGRLAEPANYNMFPQPNIGTGDLTIQGWFYMTVEPTASFRSAWYLRDQIDGSFGEIRFNAGNTFSAEYLNSSGNINMSGTWALNSWIHLALVRDNGTVTTIVNGVNSGTYANETSNLMASSEGLHMSGQRSFLGRGDEFRLATVARSVDWLATEYANQNSPATFVSVGVPIDPGQSTQSKAINQFDLAHTSDLPIEFTLSQNYPNPFNPETKIEYTLPQECIVALTIHNILGQQVATLVNNHQSAGFYSVIWQPNYLGSGIYFYQIQAGNFSQIKKMILIR